MSFPALRKRTASQPVVGGLVTVLYGALGIPTPESMLSSQVQGNGAAFHFHEGDVFTPGTGNWALDPPHETPLNTIWGHAFLRTPNTFRTLQPPQVYVSPAAMQNGIGGLVAGQVISQPLINDPTEGQF